MKKFIEWFKELPTPIAFLIFFGIPWGLAGLLLRFFDNTPAYTDSWVDYIAIVLFFAPLVYLFVIQVMGPLLKKNK